MTLQIPRAATPVLATDGTFNREWYKALQTSAGTLNTSLLSANIYTDTGVVNAAKIQSGVSNYTRGLTRYFVPKFTNTSTSVTLNDSGLGAEAIVLSDGTQPAVGIIIAGQTAEVIFNGTAWELQVTSGSNLSVPGNLTVTGTSMLSGAITAQSTVMATGAVSSSAQVTAGTFLQAATYIQHSGIVAYASLPSAASVPLARYYINNGSAGTVGTAAAGSGSTTVPVYSDGTIWRLG